MSSDFRDNTPSKSKSPKKATIADLVEKTGLSLGTVSRVLNNRSNVSEKTREIVLKAARELNLRPQGSARSKQIAVLTDPHNPDRIEGYTATLTSHLAYLLTRRGLGIAFPANPIDELPRMFLDGVIAINCVSHFSSFLSELESRMPVVYIDKFDVNDRQYCVRSDHYAAGKIAAEHFFSRGKRKLAFLAQESLTQRERLRGFADAAREQGVSLDPDCVAVCSSDGRMSALARIVRSGAEALYVPGASFEVIEALHTLTYLMRVKVPEDISVLGGENEGLSELMNPPLSTVEEPLLDMADAAVSLVEQLVNGRDVENRIQSFPVRLIERNSVRSG
ncbi:LacI family DNA-binding transcriptional regulator [Pelagicoccus albus]|uniref:LacI family DNA-binding transcriptional regulator n=1 Tax=Pelagicoccus albus TaxID=415222 RepID=A0A7X1E7U2_9BACT|nr:LacI family DNA-binding transcriptional regulator [Pelagicoccus albus]MBC2606125.1 LacI family DNA-binding transcriptional regulator [Pelagicoccus albus]